MFVLFIYNKTLTIDRYKLLEISPYKRCKGGSYMNQGDSVEAKYCREYMASDCGKYDAKRYNCGLGDVGINHSGVKNFRFTPESDSNWKNARTANCSIYDVPSDCSKYETPFSPIGTL